MKEFFRRLTSNLDFIAAVSLVIAVNIVITTLLVIYLFKEPPAINWIWVSAIFYGLYFAFGAKIMAPDEKGTKSILGRLRKDIYSGFYFLWWPFEKIHKVPKRRLELNFAAENIVTRAGFYEIEHKNAKGETEKEIRPCEPARIKIKGGIYVSFGDGEDLRQAFQFLPPSILTAANIERVLEEFLDQLVTSAIRTLGAGRTWEEDNNKRNELAEKVKEELIKDGGTFDLAGFAKTLETVITDVELPPELQAALTKVEIADRERKATVLTAEGTKQAEITVAEGKKQATILEADAEKYKKIANSEAFKVELEKQKEGLGFDTAKEFSEYLVAFEAAKGYGEGDKTVPVLLGGAANLFDLARNIAATVKGDSLK